jgi:hypothetical protein
MGVRLVIGTAALLVLLAPARGWAQETGKVGLTFGYPGAVGIVWHVTDRVAVRPEFTFSRGWSDREDSVFDSDRSSWGLGAGISALFYISKSDNLRTFISPGYSYSRGESTSSSTGLLPVVSEFTSSSSSFGGSFGAEYVFSRRFSAFGEVGVAYTHVSSGSSPGFPLRFSSHGFGTRTGAGFVLYF